MDRSIEALKKNRHKIIGFISILMIIISAAIFPILPNNLPGREPFSFLMISLLIFLRIQLINISYSLGKLSNKLYPDKPLFIFNIFFSVNAIGLLLRVYIEWGESSLMNDLTPRNIGIHLILVPVIILISYLKSNARSA